MTYLEWLYLAQERIGMVLCNEENIYLQDAIKFINAAIEEIKIGNKNE